LNKELVIQNKDDDHTWVEVSTTPAIRLEEDFESLANDLKHRKLQIGAK
jgi:hypothetical protein